MKQVWRSPVDKPEVIKKKSFIETTDKDTTNDAQYYVYTDIENHFKTLIKQIAKNKHNFAVIEYENPWDKYQHNSFTFLKGKKYQMLYIKKKPVYDLFEDEEMNINFQRYGHIIFHFKKNPNYFNPSNPSECVSEYETKFFKELLIDEEHIQNYKDDHED